MPLYRVLSKLDTGHVPGDVVTGIKNDEVTAILERKGHLRQMNTPPLDQLPGWRLRAARLRAVGIVTIDDFIGASRGDVMAAMGIQDPRTYARYKKELLDSLNVKRRRG